MIKLPKWLTPTGLRESTFDYDPPKVADAMTKLQVTEREALGVMKPIGSLIGNFRDMFFNALKIPIGALKSTASLPFYALAAGATVTRIVSDMPRLYINKLSTGAEGIIDSVRKKCTFTLNEHGGHAPAIAGAH